MVKGMLSFLLLIGFGMIVTGVCFADSTVTIEEAVKNGKISGEVGSYFEQTDAKGVNTNYGWATGYTTLKYETGEWNRIKTGARFFGHHQLYNDSSDGSDPFNVDIEKEYTLPELYLQMGFAKDSYVTAGRWHHQGLTQINDPQSEGAYVRFKEIANLDLVAGIMHRFGEMDYDDSEDFGRNNDSQDLNSEATYGPGAEPYLLFLDPKYKVNEIISLNPLVYYQHGYAGVYGLYTDIQYTFPNTNVTIGSDVDYYHVSAYTPNQGDADAWMVAPKIAKGPVSMQVGVVNLDDGDALNQPNWFEDLGYPLDQGMPYGNPNMELYFIQVGYTKDKFWTYVIYGDFSYDANSSQGDASQEMEWQVGYDLTANLSANVRLFNVLYEDIADKDYKKIETVVKYKF
jgi:hypothetical protein